MADVTDEAAVESLIANVVGKYGSLDIVVNTVGGFTAGKPVTDLSLET
jgi:NAD(P)-dependent dehydrogenase (short-subunit alcohol dehydrogenase family)